MLVGKKVSAEAILIADVVSFGKGSRGKTEAVKESNCENQSFEHEA